MNEIKGLVVFATAGFFLLAYGLYSYFSDISFVHQAVRARATIAQVHDEQISASKPDWFSSGLQAVHECRYTLTFTPEGLNNEVRSELKFIKHSPCLPSGVIVPILYDPKNPATVSFFITAQDALPGGKVVAFFGVMTIALAYFVWVGRSSKEK